MAMKQHEAVIAVMRSHGGYATLGYLYQHVLKVPGCNWGTKTPFASIRRIVQTHPAFFKIRPGLWALTSEQQKVLEELGLKKKDPVVKDEEFSHSYYQGLIVELGNLKGHETFVPHQDKNKLFLNQKLSTVASLHEYYKFTYEQQLNRAKTVDVTWFNARKFPLAFYEVEHSTPIQNSLLKFLEFQDFRTQFYIVADPVRRKEFETKLGYVAFAPIRSSVSFLDYERLSEYHAKVSALAALELGMDSSAG